MKKALLTVLLFVLIVTIAACGFWMVQYYLDAAQQNKDYQNLSEQTLLPASPPAATQVPTPTLPPDDSGGNVSPQPEIVPVFEAQHDIKALKEKNSDSLGWITIPGTEIDYPLMWTPEEPEKYLYRNFNREDSSHGAPFLDARCTLDSSNLMLYGHNMFDGSMFTDVLSFSDRDYLQDHKTIYLELEGKSLEYEAFASVRTVSDSQIFSYVELYNDEAFLADIQKECPYDIGIPSGQGNRYITLTTCDESRNGGRAVVFGKLVKEDFIV